MQKVTSDVLKETGTFITSRLSGLGICLLGSLSLIASITPPLRELLSFL